MPDARRVTLFHVVASGRCWVEVEPAASGTGPSAGDVIVLPYGDSHRMGGRNDAELVSAASLVTPPPWSEMPVIRYGEGGEATDVVCGYLTSDDALFDPRTARPATGVRGQPEHADGAGLRARQHRLRAAPDLAGRRRSRRVAHRVPRLLLAEILRIHLSSAPAAQSRVVPRAPRPGARAHARRVARRSRAQVDGGRAGEDLAWSRPRSLDERFRDVLGMPPIRYLTAWRMHTARALLSSSELAVPRSRDGSATSPRRRSAGLRAGDGAVVAARPCDRA